MIHQYCKGEGKEVRERGREGGGSEERREGGRGRERGQVLILEDDLYCHPVVILMLLLIHKKLIIKSVE